LLNRNSLAGFLLAIAIVTCGCGPQPKAVTNIPADTPVPLPMPSLSTEPGSTPTGHTVEATKLPPLYQEIQDETRRIMAQENMSSEKAKRQLDDYYETLKGALVENWHGWVSYVSPTKEFYDELEDPVERIVADVFVDMLRTSLYDDAPYAPTVSLRDVSLDQLENLELWHDRDKAFGPPWQKVTFSGSIANIGRYGSIDLMNVTIVPKSEDAPASPTTPTEATKLPPLYQQIQDETKRIMAQENVSLKEAKRQLDDYYDTLRGAPVENWHGWVSYVSPSKEIYDKLEGPVKPLSGDVTVEMLRTSLHDDAPYAPAVSLYDVSLDQLENLELWHDRDKAFGPPWQEVTFSGSIANVGRYGSINITNVTIVPK
jgi:hypothetical protein